MNESIFLAHFLNTSLAQIKEVLMDVVPEKYIRERVTLPGDELTVESGRLELYVHSSDHGRGAGTDYLGSGEYYGSMDELEQFLHKLAALFAAKGIVYDFEFYEETEDGEQVGDSQTLRHPDFG